MLKMIFKNLLKTFFLGLFFSQIAWAQQFQLIGKFTDSLPKVENIALYQIKNHQLEYVKYFKCNGQNFNLNLDSLATGSYKLKYLNKYNTFIDFIYNKENIELSLDSKIGYNSVNFIKSEENDLLLKYNNTIHKLQQNVEKAILMVLDKKPNALEKYQQALQLLEFNQQHYEKLAKEKYIYDFVVAGKRYYPKEPYKTIEAFYESSKAHYFDYIDFNNPKLRNHNFVKDKVLGFVFDFNQIKNKQIVNAMFTESLTKLATVVVDKSYLEIFYELIASQLIFREDKDGVDILLKAYHQLPKENLNTTFINQITQSSKVLIGATAPDIQIYHNLKMSQLTSDYIVLAFWSTGCAHCAIEIPSLHKITQDLPNVTVVAVGLEEKEDLKKWESKAKELTKWRHVCAPGGWDHPIANMYNLYATPTYFILDKNKTIIAKPRNDKAVEEWFKAIPKP